MVSFKPKPIFQQQIMLPEMYTMLLCFGFCFFAIFLLQFVLWPFFTHYIFSIEMLFDYSKITDGAFTPQMMKIIVDYLTITVDVITLFWKVWFLLDGLLWCVS